MSRHREVLFETDELIAIDKPANLPSLPYRDDQIENSATGIAIRHCPALSELGLDHDFGALHRLDNGTSGVLLFAKNLATQSRLRELWKTDSVVKTYRALTQDVGEPLPVFPCVIQSPIGHDAKSAKRMRVILEKADLKKIRGKPLDAWTEFMSATRCELPESKGLGFDWMLRIKTGVRHQVRLHLMAQGYPILGDSTYRGLESTRLWLHSSRLEIPSLQNQSRITIESPLPGGWPKGN